MSQLPATATRARNSAGAARARIARERSSHTLRGAAAVAVAVSGKPKADAPSSWLCGLVATSATGLLMVAIADAGARAGSGWADPVFWGALLVILLPIAYRLLGGEADRRERLLLMALLAIATYLVKVLHTPAGFDLHDELGQYRSTADILRTGRLLAHNPIVPDYAYYPGILSVTAALSRLSGLSIFVSGLIVVGVARCILVLGLFGLLERVTKSSRVAAIAVLVYAANPNFLFFDAQYAYESLALGLAVLVLWMTSRQLGGRGSAAGGAALVALMTAATVLTHHLTSYALCLVLVAWAIAHRLTPTEQPAVRRRWLGGLAFWGLASTVAWGAFAFAPTRQDIGGSITGSVQGLVNVITGSIARKAPFTAAPGYGDTSLAKMLGLLSVAGLICVLPLGLRAAWRARGRHPLVLVLGLTALAYPVTLAVRLTAAGTESSNRTSEFVFVGLATVTALAIVRWLGLRIDRGTGVARIIRLLVTALVGLAFLGGLIVGWAPFARLPGGYLVEGNPRSVNAMDVDAARWAGRRLKVNSPVLTDVDSELLMTAYGNLDPQAGNIGATSVDNVLESQTFGTRQIRLLRYDRIRYLVVDARLSSAPPASGHYFRDSAATAKPLSPRALSKFASVPGLNRVFDSGTLKIYDTSGLRGGSS